MNRLTAIGAGTATKRRTRTGREPLVQLINPSEADGRLTNGQSDEQLTLGYDTPSSSRAARWVWVAVTLVLGFALGRLPGSTSSTSAPATGSGQASIAACPSGHPCRVHEIYDPGIVRFVALALPDVRSVALTATDDARTSHRYQLTLVAIVDRGATVRITSRDNSRHARSSPWLFLSRGEPTTPLSAERALTDHRVIGLIAYISLKRTTHLPPRIGKADLVCSWCQEPNARDLSAALRHLISDAPSPLTAMLAVAVEATARGPALHRLG